MPDPDLTAVRDRLLRSGVAPRHVVRAVSELRDHLADLEAEEIEQGVSVTTARARASERIGTTESIARQYGHMRDLKLWIFRYPRTARIILPVAYYLVLPTIPIHAGLASVPTIARWGTALLLSALVTAAMLLVMQLSIAIG